MQRHKAGVRMMGWGSFSGGGGGIETAGNGLTLNGTEVVLGGVLDMTTLIQADENEFELFGASLIRLNTYTGAGIRINDNGVHTDIDLVTAAGVSLILADASPDPLAAVETPGGLFLSLSDQHNDAVLGDNNGNLLSVNGDDDAVTVVSNNPVLTNNFWVTEAFVQGTTSSPGVTNMLAIAAVANKMYRISIGITATAVGVGGSVQSQINWTDINGNSEQFLDAPITFIGNPAYRPVIINAEPGTSINVDVNITSPATISYQVSIESQLLA
jgi:hypothetical protein